MSFWTGKRVLVTGGGGFLGNHVVDQLNETDSASVFVVRQRDYDLTHEDQVIRLFAEHPADVVLHLAGYVGGIGANKARPADFFYRNLMMNTLTLHHAYKSGVKKVIAAAAGCGYPEHAPMPLKEESFWNGFPQEESAPYSLAKRMLHVQSLAYWKQHQFLAVSTIPGNIYGPYDNFDLENAHVIPALVRKFVEATEEKHERLIVWGTGIPTRDFVYAGDVAEGILRAAEVYEWPGIVNLSAGKETSIADVVHALADITNFAGQIVWDSSRPDGQSRRLFDVSKARRELDWHARTSLREGLAKTVAWYRANRATARNVG
ncbi:MAG TPA: GDP-L-fucose synthase [Gemmataceae bacterium]|nr:GDP-L-fucose synthase [Gemmataceae bacterium]